MTNLLTEQEAALFHNQGYLGPYSAITPAEMSHAKMRLESEVLSSSGPSPKNPQTMRHLDKRLVYDLVAHREITGRIAGLLGPHLLLWACTFWLKEPGGKEIPWHQDLNYWPMEPIVNVTAWIAVDEVTRKNACLQVIPGSHKKVVRHVPASKDKWFDEEADPAMVDADRAVDLELRPGEFVLFNERLLHHSPANTSDKRRFGMGPRYTIPICRIDHDRLFEGHKVILVSGEDYMGFNKLTDPPQE